MPLLYKAIKQDIYDSEERKLSIFVSVLEPDSVCALRILQVGIHAHILPYGSQKGAAERLQGRAVALEATPLSTSQGGVKS